VYVIETTNLIIIKPCKNHSLTLIGSRVGQAIVDHMDVRKVGFTGSTPIGAGIMKRSVAGILVG